MARACATKVYAATAKFPRKEDYSLTSQMNKAVNSISLNIAEGAGKKNNRAFDYHLEIALGSAFEVVAAAFLSLARGYISRGEQADLYNEGTRVCKSINAFRSTLRPR